MSVTLGLDLGPNSIGWALVDDALNKILASGVRVFPEGVDAFDTAKEKSRTQERRTKRGMRRQIARRSRRKRNLRALLAAHGLLPAGLDEQSRVLKLDPYLLRARGLDHPLTPHEFGRVLYHLATRRGFLSNSKSDKAKAKETSDMLKEISALAKEIQEAGHRTLGEHLASLSPKPGETPLVRLRCRHTRRQMLQEEFEMLWAAQKPHHPAILTDELKHKLHDPTGDETWWMRGAIFGQRNLYWPSTMIGKCEYEPKEKRSPKAERIAQRYRMVSEVNNLKYIDRGVRPLDPDQRALLLDRLTKTKEMTFDQVRKALNFLDTIKFNLEGGKRAKLKGHLVDCIMAKESPWGKSWWEMSEQQKDSIVHLLADPRNSDEEIKNTAISQWGLTASDAEQLLSINLPAGYTSLSRKAMEKLLPHLETGLLLMTDDATPCALTEAGYLRPDQRQHNRQDRLPEPPELPNPVVRRTLHELRRVVNAILREFPRPDRIHVELARSIKMGPNDRDEYNKARADREEARDRAAEDIRTNSPGTRLSRDLIDKYLLWKDQGEICIYSGRVISLNQLLSGEVDVDHILPRWRSLDDSFTNKVVCFRDMNHEKGDRTPHEWLSGQPDRFEALKQRVRALPFRKRARFSQEELNTDEFSARQLVDTAYITRAACDYLRCLVDRPHDVLGSKGTYTAELRHLWGIETILSELPDSPAWAAKIDLRPGEKNRADHRHHAIDAVVVAFTDRSRLQKLSQLYKTGQSGAEVEPWQGFRDSVVDTVKAINVSHRVQRKVAGALHEETIYGPVRKMTITGELQQQPGEFVVRKALDALTPAMVEDIRDTTIRQIVIDRLKERDAPIGRAAKGNIPKDVWEPPLTMPSGVPIRRVRIIKRDDTIQPIRSGSVYVKPGSTHHLCIFERTEKGKKKYDDTFTTTLDANNRVRARNEIIQGAHPERPEAKFVMSLSRGEAVIVEDKNGARKMVVKTSVSTEHRVVLVDMNDARKASAKEIISPPVGVLMGKLRARKITVDPLGRIRWAND